MNNIEDRLTGLVADALKNELRDTTNMNFPFLDIEDYTRKTGKRFRRTKKHLEEGQTREQAFQLFMESLVEKG